MRYFSLAIAQQVYNKHVYILSRITDDSSAVDYCYAETPACSTEKNCQNIIRNERNLQFQHTISKDVYLGGFWISQSTWSP